MCQEPVTSGWFSQSRYIGRNMRVLSAFMEDGKGIDCNSSSRLANQTKT